MLSVPVGHDVEDLPDMYEQLHSIKEINFTKREIDVIACILHGRVTKKIAIILAISYKTVGTHIGKIMLKIGCRSQEWIIDFIEGSNKYKLIRQHYVMLLTNHEFRQELTNIRDLMDKQNEICIIVADDFQKKYERIFDKLCECLKLTGIITSFVKADDVKPNNCIGYVLHCCFSIDGALSNIASSNIDLQHILVVSFGPQTVKSSSAVLNSVMKINLHDYDNQCFFAFAVIQKLLPKINIEPNIAAFKKLYAIHLNSSSELSAKKFKCSLNDPNIADVSQLADGFTWNVKLKLNLRNKKFWLVWCSLAMAMGCGGFFFNQYINGHKNTFLANNKLISAKSRSVVWNLPRQDHSFIGRKGLLKELQIRLHPKIWHLIDANRLSIINVCAGLGGVGKTQLALQYVHNTKRDYSLKAWFFSENIDQLKQQYVALASELGYSAIELSFAKAQLYVKEWLSEHPGWLLVYDNVNSYNEIKEFLPKGRGSIILTSRQQKWPNTFEKLDVEVMTEGEAMQLIESLLQRKITAAEQKSLQELVIELGCLPLALAQAGAYIKQNAMTITDYIKLYKKHEQDLLMDSTLPEGINSLPIATTWNISLDAIVRDARINDQSPWALHLLNACAYLAPEKISEQLLLAWIKAMHPEVLNAELLLTKLLGQLHQYSMISRDDNRNVTIHRLVQAVVRYQHKHRLEKKQYYTPLTQQWFNSLLNSVRTEFIKKTTVSEDEMRQKHLLPHMQSLSYHHQQIWPKAKTLHMALTLHNLGDGLQLIGEYGLSKAYYEKALLMLEQDCNKNYAEVTLTLDQLGSIYRMLGNIKQAKILHERSLQIKEKHYAKDHLAIAHTLDHLGRDYRMLGDAKRAQTLHERALGIKEKYYVKDHIEIAMTLDYLGRDYLNLFNITKSKALHERCLQIKEKYYGDNHFEVAMTLDYLGRSYRISGDAPCCAKIALADISLMT